MTGGKPILVTATFTAEPVRDTLEFWLAELGLDTSVEFSSYGQVFQSLLDPTSPASRAACALHAVLVRLEDWNGAGPESGPLDDRAFASIERSAMELVDALSNGAATRTTVLLTPPSAGVRADARASARLREIESAVVEGLRTGAGAVTVARLAEPLGEGDWDAGAGPQQGHIPYSLLGYTAIATAIARRAFQALTSPAKVLVLDCDNTLWGGVVGEDGVDGVTFEDRHLAVQRFAVAERRAGRLVCLCSKNVESDVLDVFARRGEMVLGLDDVVATRINWLPKAENVAALAGELGLGLDSFVFLDDSAVEVAEMRALRPEVLSLEIGGDLAAVTRRLDAIWSLGSAGATDVDAGRTDLYRAHSQRERARSAASTFAEFLSRLELDVRIAPLDATSVERAAQLFARTNQFITTTRRRTADELRRVLDEGVYEGFVVDVRDRFGDYGTVGVALFAECDGELEVEALLISCRALGRGVESHMLARLGELASERGLETVRFRFHETERNAPARAFLDRVADRSALARPGTAIYLVATPIARAATATDHAGADAVVARATGREPGTTTRTSSPSSRVETLTRIAEELADPKAVHAVVRARSRRSRPDAVVKMPYAEPDGALERYLAAIWSEVLVVDRVGALDDFFELGGDSLKGTIVVNRLQEGLGEFVYIVALFEAPTVRALASYLRSHYSATVHRLPGGCEAPATVSVAEGAVSVADVDRFRDRMESSGAGPAAAPRARRNPQAVFVLSPPRSGSTLFRAMLAGNPALFAPPELELLGFETLGERRDALSGRDGLFREGLVRAIMEVKSCDADRAARLMRACEVKNMPVRDLYGQLQQWIGARRLVDKTPSYSLDRRALARAERDFERPLYVHLLRHPGAMVASFAEARLDRFFFRFESDMSARRLGEITWLTAHRNIVEFLSDVEPERHMAVRFEELVRDPETVLSGVCRFLGVEFTPEMARPYDGKTARMTDGVHPESRMIGDVKFHEHRDVDPSVADRWVEALAEFDLSEPTWTEAEALGYPRREATASATASPIESATGA